MAKKEIMIIGSPESFEPLTFAELCEICHLPRERVYIFIEHDIIHPKGRREEEWEFDLQQLKRVQRALRLQHDLELNLQGVALALDLLEELEELRNRNALFEKHFFKL